MEQLSLFTKSDSPLNMESHIRCLLRHIGEDPHREGLLETPSRMLKAWEEMLRGYRLDPQETLSKTFEGDNYDEIVLVKDVEFVSFCEHHFLPFQGVAHVAYLPNKFGRIVGLSKLARLVDVYACRLQVQERMTHQILAALEKYLQPAGAAVTVQASHSCMSCRGVRKRGASMVTSAMSGVFKNDPATRAEFFALVRS